MKALLLVAHGSRKQSSNAEVATLAQQVASCDSDFEAVRHCFLELTEPKASEAINELVDQGCCELTVLPYFLAAGHHVLKDFPEIIEQAKEQYPQLAIKLLPHFGAAKQMSNWIIQLASKP